MKVYKNNTNERKNQFHAQELTTASIAVSPGFGSRPAGQTAPAADIGGGGTYLEGL